MVSSLAKQSGGRVAIESKVERETTVRLYLPQAKTAAPRRRRQQRNRRRKLLDEDQKDVSAQYRF